MAREQTSLGMSLAASFGEQLCLGAGVEWRRSSIREEISDIHAEGDADAVRFSLGAILQVRQWHLGISAQSRYKASAEVTYDDSVPLIRTDVPSEGRRPADFYRVSSARFSFSYHEPITIRFGLATPYVFGRLRFSADAENKDFASTDDPIEPWQFYGGGNLKLTSNVHLGFGAFTFRKDYSAYIEGPDSEVFLTAGGSLEFSQFRFSGSFMDGDLLTENFAGQRFINFAVSFVVP
jgi:hypothetical protein